MAGQEVATVKKPNLRGFGTRQWGMCLAFSLVASSTFAVWFKKNVVEARKQHYKDFYDTYDDAKEYNAMKAAGVFKGFEWS